MSELVSVSLRIPKKLDSDLDDFVEKGGYASKTEVLREALRALLYRQVDDMTGALKGANVSARSLAESRRLDWDAALAQAQGDAKKALKIVGRLEKRHLKGLRL
jgi:Arc/MetJ-type ribon-helix-helix transcriptional regulator